VAWATPEVGGRPALPRPGAQSLRLGDREGKRRGEGVRTVFGGGLPSRKMRTLVQVDAINAARMAQSLQSHVEGAIGSG
jgi:hypothetical protein